MLVIRAHVNHILWLTTYRDDDEVGDSQGQSVTDNLINLVYIIAFELKLYPIFPHHPHKTTQILSLS